MSFNPANELESLDIGEPIWERVFTVAPLVLIGTLEESGEPDLAPKHMAFPMGWDNYFGFVCAPSHRTQQNIQRDQVFTVSYPRPSQLVTTALAATPRDDGDAKPILGLLKTFPASVVDGVLVTDSYFYLECETERIVNGFGANSLIVGRVVAAHVHRDALRISDGDDAELLTRAPLAAYLYPGRFAVVDETQAFPFPAGMRR